MVEEQEDKFSQGANEKVGDYLRRIRKSRGLELEQLAKSIRLGLSVLQAIEENNWEFFPTEAYLRSYIGSICEKLSIDKIIVLKRLSSEINSHFGVAQINIIDEQDSEGSSSPSNISKIAIIIILVTVAILFFANKILNDFSEVDDISEEKPTLEAPSQDTEEPAEKDGDSISDTLSQSELAVPQANVAALPPIDLNKVDTLRFECSPAPKDDKCGIKIIDLNTTMGWFKNVSYRYINSKDTAQIVITVPWRTRLFVNGTRLEYGNFNTLSLHNGQIIKKSNKDLR
jgi:transcriptional regulator with XRE-family HTH domain